MHSSQGKQESECHPQRISGVFPAAMAASSIQIQILVKCSGGAGGMEEEAEGGEKRGGGVDTIVTNLSKIPC